MKQFLDSLKYDSNGLVTAIAQDVDTGAILMQGFASRLAIAYTLHTQKGVLFLSLETTVMVQRREFLEFYQRRLSARGLRQGFLDIFRRTDGTNVSHGGAHVLLQKGGRRRRFDLGAAKDGRHKAEEALTTLYELEATIAERKREVIKEGAKPSWTRRLLEDPELLCSKIREEAGELCETYEKDEGKRESGERVRGHFVSRDGVAERARRGNRGRDGSVEK